MMAREEGEEEIVVVMRDSASEHDGSWLSV